MLPPLALKNVSTELRQKEREIHGHPVPDDAAALDVPEVRITDDDARARGRNLHKNTAMGGLDKAETRHPLALN